jgi:hypothetical protein
VEVVKGFRLPERKGLPAGADFCHESGMAKQKKNAAAVALGRLGGLRGGKARASVMTAAERSASARKAVLARWAKAKKSKKERLSIRERSRKVAT